MSTYPPTQVQRMSFRQLREMQRNQLEFGVTHTQANNGVAAFNIFGMGFYLVTRPSLVRELLVKHSNKMHRDPFVTRALGQVTGNGVFMAEGADWKRQRKLVQPAFHAMRIRNYADIMATYASEMVAAWQDGEQRSIDKDFTELTLRIIAKTMYGVDIEEQTAEIGRLMKIALGVAQDQLEANMVLPAWVPTPQHLKQKRALREIRALLSQIVAERRAQNEDKGDLLSMLLQVRYEDGSPMPEEQLLDELLTLFVAGHETTAASLSWCWHLLIQNPDVAERLYAEIDSKLNGNLIQFEQIAELPYLDAFIKETLRLYPPAPGFARSVQQSFTAEGITFPKRAVIMFMSFAAHRDPAFFDAPDEFNPERFLDNDNLPDRYTYFPFGAGPRICLGNMFSMMETAVILATMIQKIRCKPTTDVPVELDMVVTLRPKEALVAEIERRG